MFRVDNSWDGIFAAEKTKTYYKELQDFVEAEYKIKAIYPPKDDLFRAFELTPFEEVRVVILGQDPYHQKNQSHGLCFSVKQGNRIPPSLVNIYKEICSSFNVERPKSGDLTHWARQGVLLLNTILTVEDSKPLSHKNIGWQRFTDHAMISLNKSKTPIVFMLWGNNAKEKAELITNPIHKVLTAVHPSPLSASRGFFGCNHFVLANEFLLQNNLSPIKWI